jgi:hypothetical protein
MAEAKFSAEFLATSLIEKLNRRNIFPPLFNNPESFVAPAGSKAKRPLNSFLICRRNVCEEASRKGTHNMRVISKATSILWNNASNEERGVYKRIADRVYDLHVLRNPSSFKVELTTQSPEEPSNLPSLTLSFPSHPPIPLSSTLETVSHIAFDDYHLNTVDNSSPSYTGTYFNDNNQIILFNYNDPNSQYHFLPYNGFNHLY